MVSSERIGTFERNMSKNMPYSMKKNCCTLRSTKRAIENEPFEDVVPAENEDFPLCTGR